MLDLHQRLQELADAATRDGATPGPAHAIRRGRQRRRRIAAGVASLLLVAVVAGAAGTGQLGDRPTRTGGAARRALDHESAGGPGPPGAGRGHGPVVGGHQVGAWGMRRPEGRRSED